MESWTTKTSDNSGVLLVKEALAGVCLLISSKDPLRLDLGRKEVVRSLYSRLYWHRRDAVLLQIKEFGDC
jgi:hypothetical protein